MFSTLLLISSRCIASILGWVKFLLQSEQKKTDFKPETEMATFDADKSTAVSLLFKSKDTL